MALPAAEQKRFDQYIASAALEGIECSDSLLKLLKKAWEDLDGVSPEEEDAYIAELLTKV